MTDRQDNQPAAVQHFLTPGELCTLGAICDTLLPSLDPPAGLSADLTAYYRRSAADLAVPEQLEQLLLRQADPTQRQLFRLSLRLLQNPVALGAMSGRTTPFHLRRQPEREAILLRLAHSRLPQLRRAFQVFKRLAGFLFFTLPTADRPNPNAMVLGYPLPVHVPVPPAPPAQLAFAPLAANGDTELEADFCVVGSGAGGGVAAALLAQAGYRVLVLEAGGYYETPDFGPAEDKGWDQLFMNGGLLTGGDDALLLLAGRTLGGGTTVNWLTSLRPPAYVLAEWRRASGVEWLESAELQRSFGAVEQRLAVGVDPARHNSNNQVLIDGAAALGWHSAALPRNSSGCGDCGICTFGCSWGAKQSTLRTYLHDACAAGAQLVANCQVERVIIRDGRATGVEAHIGATQRRLRVKSGAVIVSAGAIQSPALLLRSGVRLPQLGRNLFLHPATVVGAVFDREIAAWSGPMQSAYSEQFADPNGTGYGYMLEVAPIYPGLGATVLPWMGARSFRRLLLQLPRTAALLVLARDRVGGRITLNAAGRPLIDYRLPPELQSRLLQGTVEAARLAVAAGAHAAFSFQQPISTLVVGGREHKANELERFARRVKRRGAGPHQLGIFSAHQMGTCRLGVDAATSVVDPTGALHGYRSLYVIDGSIFPGSSGVNPMLTILGLAHYVAGRVVQQGL